MLPHVLPSAHQGAVTSFLRAFLGRLIKDTLTSPANPLSSQSDLSGTIARDLMRDVQAFELAHAAHLHDMLDQHLQSTEELVNLVKVSMETQEHEYEARCYLGPLFGVLR